MMLLLVVSFCVAGNCTLNIYIHVECIVRDALAHLESGFRHKESLCSFETIKKKLYFHLKLCCFFALNY
jgi:hypothetical protein